MNIVRNEIRTGLLVIVTVAALVAALIYLGAPGVFVKQKTFRIFFDNAGGLKPGAQVLLAGRKIGQVTELFSPVPEKDRPTPKMEALVEVQVADNAKIYTRVKALMTQTSLLGETIIDFTSGEEASGLAADGASFLGERPPSVSEVVPAVLDKIDPALQKVTATLDSLQKTSDNLTRITDKDSDLPIAFAEMKKFGTNLNELSGPDSSLRRSLANIQQATSEEGKLGQTLNHLETLTGPESDLARTLANAKRFTNDLAGNQDIEVTLRNFRQASDKLNRTVDTLGGSFSAVGANLEQATDTVKRQPWRLIWPSTKKYDEDGRAKPPQPRLETPKKKPQPTPKPKRRAFAK